jgi:hypothetical protein
MGMPQLSQAELVVIVAISLGCGWWVAGGGSWPDSGGEWSDIGGEWSDADGE